jgi:secondary thiamine-phosphate synthase enzyme
MITQKQIHLPAYPRGFHLITALIRQELPKLPDQGLLNLFIQHTSAALTINENADPDVRHDMEKSLDGLVPEHQPHFLHTLEGPDDMPAHIKTALLDASLTIPITNGRLALGTWQGIYLCEFRNRAGARKVLASIYS